MSNNNLIFLQHTDFKDIQGQRGRILANQITGVSFILFYSTECNHCHSTLPVFKNLPKHLPSVKFALVNLNAGIDIDPEKKGNMRIVEMAAKTIAPITSVPFIALYINGRPYMQYVGPRTVENIVPFIKQNLDFIRSKSTFMKKQGESCPDNKPGLHLTEVFPNIDSDMPAFASGIPYNLVCDNDSCYLTVDQAYKKTKLGQNQQPRRPHQSYM